VSLDGVHCAPELTDHAECESAVFKMLQAANNMISHEIVVASDDAFMLHDSCISDHSLHRCHSSNS